jgi:hypothetical protein
MPHSIRPASHKLIDPLCSYQCLQEEMLLPSSAMDEPQRPYKVFISLLDKWEIGYPLTDVLVEDALRALKLSLDNGHDPDVSPDSLLVSV